MRLVTLALGLAACANTSAPIEVSNPVTRVMDVCGAEGTLRTLRMVETEAAKVLPTLQPEQRLPFLILVCIESRFDPNATSPVGAVGLTQIMPKYYAGFAKECGIATSQKRTTFVVAVAENLAVGACRFRLLFEKFGGNMALVLGAYNAGENSATIKKLQNLERINPETSQYLSNYFYIWSVLQQPTAGGSGETLPAPS
jgi:hypothetical protein